MRLPCCSFFAGWEHISFEEQLIFFFFFQQIARLNLCQYAGSGRPVGKDKCRPAASLER
jgi:hypothetical protein